MAPAIFGEVDILLPETENEQASPGGTSKEAERRASFEGGDRSAKGHKQLETRLALLTLPLSA